MQDLTWRDFRKVGNFQHGRVHNESREWMKNSNAACVSCVRKFAIQYGELACLQGKWHKTELFQDL